MKDFLENYGFAILATIIVVLLIAFTGPVGNLIKTRIESITESFTYRIEIKMADAFEDHHIIEEPHCEGGNHIYIYNNENVSWRNIGGTMKAFFKYYCICGEKYESELVTPTFVDNEGIRTYTAVSPLHEGVSATKTITVYYSVTLNGVSQPSVYAWGEICVLAANENRNWYLASDLETALAENTNTYIFAVTGNTNIVSVIATPSPALISFTINDKGLYQAEEGMTWKEFVNSEYNLDNYWTLYGNNIVDKDGIFMLETSNEKNDVIINGATYWTELF